MMQKLLIVTELIFMDVLNLRRFGTAMRKITFCELADFFHLGFDLSASENFKI